MENHCKMYRKLILLEKSIFKKMEKIKIIQNIQNDIAVYRLPSNFIV